MSICKCIEILKWVFVGVGALVGFWAILGIGGVAGGCDDDCTKSFRWVCEQMGVNQIGGVK